MPVIGVDGVLCRSHVLGDLQLEIAVVWGPSALPAFQALQIDSSVTGTISPPERTGSYRVPGAGASWLTCGRSCMPPCAQYTSTTASACRRPQAPRPPGLFDTMRSDAELDERMEFHPCTPVTVNRPDATGERLAMVVHDAHERGVDRAMLALRGDRGDSTVRGRAGDLMHRPLLPQLRPLQGVRTL